MWWHNIERFADSIALKHSSTTMSYAELADAADALAAQLPPGRHLIALRPKNSIAAIVSLLAALRHNHPVLVTDAEQPVGFGWGAFQPSISLDAVTGDLPIIEHRDLPASTMHQDLAMLLSTSGSTGSPKFVRLSQDNVDHNARTIAHRLKLTKTDVGMTSLPPYYCYGLSVITSHLSVGASLTLTDASIVDDEFWQAVAATGVTTLATVPFSFECMDALPNVLLPQGVNAPAVLTQLPALNRIIQAGGKLPDHYIDRYLTVSDALGFELHVMYGQTEATARMAMMPPDELSIRPSSAGTAVDDSSFMLLSLDVDHPKHAEGVGELIFTGPGVMMGYATTTDHLALGPMEPHLRTGDIARVDENNYLYIVGRLNRFAKPAGKRIDLDMVEAMLEEHHLENAATHDQDHIYIGYVGTVKPADVTHLLKNSYNIPPHKITVANLPQVPRKTSGKKDRSQLVELVTQHAPQKGQPKKTTLPVTQRLINAYNANIEGAQATADSSFTSLGGDSLSYSLVSEAIEDIIRQLPENWQRQPISELAALAPTAAHDDTPEPWWHRMFRPSSVDRSVVLRAVAILAVTITHFQLFKWSGLAHPLLALIGYNLVRFRQGDQMGATSVLKTAGKTVAYSWPLLLIIWAIDRRYDLSVLYYGHFLDTENYGNHTTRMWFLETALWSTVAVGIILLVPFANKAWNARPFTMTVGLTVIMLAVLQWLGGPGEVVGNGDRPQTAGWLLALGLTIGYATKIWHKAVVTGLAAIGCAFYWYPYPYADFSEVRRDLVMFVALCALIWLRNITLPRFLVAPVAAIGSATLFIYIFQWVAIDLFFYPGYVIQGVSTDLLSADGWKWVGVVAAVVTGVIYSKFATYGYNRAGRLWRHIQSSRTERIDGDHQPASNNASAGSTSTATEAGNAAGGATGSGDTANATPRDPTGQTTPAGSGQTPDAIDQQPAAIPTR